MAQIILDRAKVYIPRGEGIIIEFNDGAARMVLTADGGRRFLRMLGAAVDSIEPARPNIIIPN